MADAVPRHGAVPDRLPGRVHPGAGLLEPRTRPGADDVPRRRADGRRVARGTWAQQYVIENSAATGSSGMQISQTLSLIGFIGGFIHAGAMGLLIAAVFMGRRGPTEHRGFQVMPGAPGWPPAPPPPQMPPLGPRG